MKPLTNTTAACFLLIVAIWGGCKKEDQLYPNPVADFSFDGANIFAPAKVVFTNRSIDANSFTWDFGDGSTSYDRDTYHLFRYGGTFNVTLTAMNGQNGSNKLTKTVTIRNAPTKLSITKVEVTKMPFTNSNGAGWDLLSGPDVYFKISDDSGADYFTSGGRDDQTSANMPLSYISGLPYVITNLDFRFRIDLWDYDNALSSDWIGGNYFKVRDFMPTNGDLYPPLFELGSPTSVVRFRLSMTWQ